MVSCQVQELSLEHETTETRITLFWSEAAHI
jgi:hypothetical protein